MSVYCIYALVDQNGVVFYIGQTNNFNRRIKVHEYHANRTSKLYCHNKLRKIMTKYGLAASECAVILEDDISDDMVDEKEINYIRHYKSLGIELTNLTEGGRGSKTYSQRTQRKAADKRKGRKLSQETKRRISESNKGRTFSQVHLDNLSKARKNRQISDQTKIKCSKTSTGKINIKSYVLIDPDGNEHVAQNGLASFCRQHGLCAQNLSSVLAGRRNHHKGWTIRRHP